MQAMLLLFRLVAQNAWQIALGPAIPSVISVEFIRCVTLLIMLTIAKTENACDMDLRNIRVDMLL